MMASLMAAVSSSIEPSTARSASRSCGSSRSSGLRLLGGLLGGGLSVGGVAGFGIARASFPDNPDLGLSRYVVREFDLHHPIIQRADRHVQRDVLRQDGEALGLQRGGDL